MRDVMWIIILHLSIGLGLYWVMFIDTPSIINLLKLPIRQPTYPEFMLAFALMALLFHLGKYLTQKVTNLKILWK